MTHDHSNPTNRGRNTDDTRRTYDGFITLHPTHIHWPSAIINSTTNNTATQPKAILLSDKAIEGSFSRRFTESIVKLASILSKMKQRFLSLLLLLLVVVLYPASTDAFFSGSRTATRTKKSRLSLAKTRSKKTGTSSDEQGFIQTRLSKINNPSKYIYTNKPLLRGEFHRIGALLYPLLLGLPLYLRASTADHKQAALLFSCAVEGILVVSAVLHTFPWLLERHERHYMVARKADFAMIFLGIALLYSSIGKILLGHLEVFRNIIEPLVWTCAGVGVLLKSFFPEAPPWVNALIFLLQGWAMGPLLPRLFQTATLAEACGLVAGGIFITLGATAYSVRWPEGHWKFHPKVFGPHEMFHVGTLFMFVAFWCTMWLRMGQQR